MDRDVARPAPTVSEVASTPVSHRPRSLVVGGSRGIGATIAECLLGRGHDVSVLSRRPSPQPIADVAYHCADLADTESCAKTIDTIAASRLNHLVFVQRHRGQGDDWEGELNVSVLASRRVIERLADRFTAPASVVFVSSVNATLISPSLPVSYHVAKAAVNQMARYYAVLLGPRGVRVNSVSSSTVIKPETEQHYANSASREVFEQVVPLARMGTATDVAKAVAFLCSDDSAFITGQDLVVDGGASLEWQESLALRLNREQPPARDR